MNGTDSNTGVTLDALVTWLGATSATRSPSSGAI